MNMVLLVSKLTTLYSVRFVENLIENRKMIVSSSPLTSRKPMTRNKGEKEKQKSKMVTYADAVKKDIHVNNRRPGLIGGRKLKLNCS